jgi:hypothetical protein
VVEKYLPVNEVLPPLLLTLEEAVDWRRVCECNVLGTLKVTAGFVCWFPFVLCNHSDCVFEGGGGGGAAQH